MPREKPERALVPFFRDTETHKLIETISAANQLWT
jgi:hypothetical protein